MISCKEYQYNDIYGLNFVKSQQNDRVFSQMTNNVKTKTSQIIAMMNSRVAVIVFISARALITIKCVSNALAAIWVTFKCGLYTIDHIETYNWRNDCTQYLITEEKVGFTKWRLILIYVGYQVIRQWNVYFVVFRNCEIYWTNFGNLKRCSLKN